jgi:triacylglycerol esterase/lipase EstA (alpha/beta hydrolase family)
MNRIYKNHFIQNIFKLRSNYKSIKKLTFENPLKTVLNPKNPLFPLKKSNLSYNERRNYLSPKGSIVLCHGLFGFDKMGPEWLPMLQIHYWKGIHDALKDIGCKVYVGKVSRTGNVKERAIELKKMIELNCKNQNINLIAHSMGGLDCRYMIAHCPPENVNILSLTTIATPHRGTTFMDWCRDMFQVGHLNGNGNDQIQLEQDKNLQLHVTQILKTITTPLDAPAFANLTTNYCQNIFNKKTPNSLKIKYYSFGAAINDIPFYSPLKLPFEIVKSNEGPNDGLVSIESAKWGIYLGTLTADHWQLTNRRYAIRRSDQFKLEKDEVNGKQWLLDNGENENFDTIRFYLKLATFLNQQGF